MSQFFLDPDITFLNHGSFGATPKPVMKVYQDWQLEMERQPVDFYARRAEGLLLEAKKPLATFLGTRPERLAWVQNATAGTNTAAWSLGLKEGDEVIVNDHEYGAFYRNLLYLSRRFGFSLKQITLPDPLEDPQQIVDATVAAITPATRLIVLSHITSPTALLFPAREIIRAAKERDILTLIDGAHAPGHIDLNLEELGPDFYVGNLHKWMSAPKSAAFLYVDPARQKLIEPLIVGWAYDPKTPMLESDWISLTQGLGTRELAGYLSVPAALEFHQEFHNAEVRARCRAEIQRWLDSCGLRPSGYRSPLQMGAARLPSDMDGFALHNWLWEKHRVEVPVQKVGEHTYLRPSYNSYSRPEQLDKLTSLIDVFRKI